MNSALSSRQQNGNGQIQPQFSWDTIDTVFLDLDGTLLDRYFDDYFWEQYVPEIFARERGISYEGARDHLLQTYRSVQNTLAWTDLDYWSEKLDLDIPGLKRSINHLISLRPEAEDFLHFLKTQGKEVLLVTNAHPKTLGVKMDKVPLTHWFDKTISATDIGFAKEQEIFWHTLQEQQQHDKTRTLFIDDNEKVLQSAAGYGIDLLVHIAKPSSRQPLAYSPLFPSIAHFTELIELAKK